MEHGLPQDELWTHYQKDLNLSLEKAGFTRELYDHWQQRTRDLKLEDDPVVTALDADELSEELLSLQEKFQAQGIDKFACKEFHPVVGNMRRCLARELKSRPPRIASELDKLDKNLERISRADDISYLELLVLTFRFMAVSHALAGADYPSHVLLSRPRSGGPIQTLTENSLQSLLAAFNNITCEDIQKDPSLLSSLSKEALGEDSSQLYLNERHELLHRYLNAPNGKLLWFCFNVLSAEFFMKTPRYSIYISGLLAEPAVYTNHGLLSPSEMPLHDIGHTIYAYHSTPALPPLEQACHYQWLCKTMEAALVEIEADQATAFAIRFFLTFATHDAPLADSRPFLGFSSFARVCQGILDQVNGGCEDTYYKGSFEILPGVRAAHFSAAKKFWAFWYPRSLSFHPGRGQLR